MGMINDSVQNTTPVEPVLIFDNYPFKLAVIQQLMYESDLLGDKYYGGDQYFETYGDVSHIPERVCLDRLETLGIEVDLFA